jgi:glycosyltransferase involved in cell wall biosynthesis
MVSSNLLSQVPRRLCGAKLITTVHNAFEPSAWMMGWADRVITVSAANATDLIKRKVPEKRIRVVWNGPINSPRLPTTFEDVILPKPTIVTVCGLHHRKRVEDILEAAAMVLKSVPSASFYLVGEGPDLEKLENMTQTLGISASVHFMGYQANPLPWMKAADIFVLASRAEPFGLVLAEARSQGCAIVATNVDGIPEVLEHGKAGILVPPLSPIDLAREITLLLQNDDRLREFRSRAKAGCDWLTVERMEQNVRDVYFDALGRPNAAATTAARL